MYRLVRDEILRVIFMPTEQSLEKSYIRIKTKLKIKPVLLFFNYLVIFTIGFPMQAFGGMIFKRDAMVGAISVISTASEE